MDTSRSTATPALADRYLREREVRARYGNIGRATLFRWRKAGGFPAPVNLGPTRSTFWRLSELLAWEVSRAAANDGGAR